MYTHAKNLLIFIVFSLLVSANAGAANTVEGVRIWPSPDNTRVVFDLSDTPDYTYFSLKNPHRLVIDLKNTDDKVDFSQVKTPKSLIKKIRQSKAKDSSSIRVVLELHEEVKPRLFKLNPSRPYGHRLVVDLQDINFKEPVQVVKQTIQGDRDIVIAIDAGHGGHDPGSVGPRGTYEKHITYAISQKLATLINNEKGMKAYVTRQSDYFVKIGRRTELARREKADLLISIHADAFHTPQPRGASVWILTMTRANSEIGRWLERSERHSELLGGAAEVIQDTKSEKYLAQALLDMSMDHSLASGYDLSNQVIRELKKVTKMHKKTPQMGNFGVLKSPDIPSILVETGFISNPEEERLLNIPSHQQKLADAIFNATKTFFSRQPPDGTLYAKLRNLNREHIVQRGESLSVLAHRYKVSMQSIKDVNNLDKTTLRIGQILKIPAS